MCLDEKYQGSVPILDGEGEGSEHVIIGTNIEIDNEKKEEEGNP